VTESNRLIGDIPRKATWAERAHLATLREAGVADVFVDPEDAPGEFWQSLAYATDALLQGFSSASSNYWKVWAQEFLWSTGWPPSEEQPGVAYQHLVVGGIVKQGPIWNRHGVGNRFAAVEHLLDLVGDDYCECRSKTGARAGRKREHFELEVTR